GPIMGDTLMGRLSLLSQTRSDWIDNAFTGEEEALGGHEELAGRAQLLWQPTSTFSVLGNVHSRTLDGTAMPFRANSLSPGSNDLNGNFDRETVSFDGGGGNPQLYDSVGGSINVTWDLPTFTLSSISGYETTNGRSRGDIDGGNMVTGPGFIPFPSDTQDSI